MLNEAYIQREVRILLLMMRQNMKPLSFVSEGLRREMVSVAYTIWSRSAATAT